MPMPEFLEALPTLGVGASLSFGMDPDPTTLVQFDGGPDFVEYAGAVHPELVAGSVAALAERGVPVLYHPSCLNLCGPWPNPAPWLDAVRHHVETVRSPWLAQDVAVCFVGDTPGYSNQLGYFLGPILTRASLEEAVQRVMEVRARVPVPLLLEPPPATHRLGSMPMLAWLNELAQRTDCGLLLDAGHVWSHVLVEGADTLDMIDADRVVELHVAGGLHRKVGQRRYYIDAHDLPIQPEVWGVFDALLDRCTSLRAVCVECEGAAAAQVLPVLADVRQRVMLKSASPTLRAQSRVGRPPMPGVVHQRCAPVASASQPPVDTGYPALLQTLFHPEALARLVRDGRGDLSPVLAQDIDAQGVVIDAEGRHQYLMSALCRSFPVSAAALGALLGTTPLVAFLASPALLGPMAARTAAFGDHLQRLVDLVLDGPAPVVAGVGALLAWERALVDSARALRDAVSAGAPVPNVTDTPGSGPLAVAPFAVVMELPLSPSVVQAALQGVGPGDCWRRIAHGDLDGDRLVAALLGKPSPVTLLARALVPPQAPIAVSGIAGVPDVIEVSHRTAELPGRQGGRLRAMLGEPLGDLPPRSQNTALRLVQAGLLVAG